ncbi:MAG: hypothetical protein GY727_11210, partial [Gammaproteobacteria bacterium]|nr:hypothetical protein [Gammaproteobacteria bacterium]
IGRVERGFVFLGYFLKLKKLAVALSTLKRFKQRMTQLYEQGADYFRIGEYVSIGYSGSGQVCQTYLLEGLRGTDNILLNSACPSLNNRPLSGKY